MTTATTTAADYRELGHQGFARLSHHGATPPIGSIDPPEVRYAIVDLPRELRTPAVVDAIRTGFREGWKEAYEATQAAKAPAAEKPRPALTITHTAAEGTLLEGSRKGDGAWDVLRLLGWRWSRHIGIYVRHSRDRLPNRSLVERSAEALRAAGFDVDVEIDATLRPMEESEADRAERMEDRADQLSERADRHAAAGAARDAAEHAILDGIPMGQPILVGHHSEGRHRRTLARAEGHRRASSEHYEKAGHAAHGAETAAVHMSHRENPHVVSRRLDELQADRRGVQRELDGYTRRSLDGNGEPVYVWTTPPAEGARRERLLERAAELDEKIRYWTEMHEKHKAEGLIDVVDWSKVRKNDLVKIRGRDVVVVKVNPKNVRVMSSGLTLDYPKHEVQGHTPLTDEQRARIEAATKD